MSNREYKSDTQTGYDKSKFNPDNITNVVGSKSNLKTSATGELNFCPNCGGVIYPHNGSCSCGYVIGNQNYSQRYSTSKTYLELNVKKHNLKINDKLFVSGYLRLKHDYILVNAEIEIYISGQFLKSTFTDEDGYYQFTFPVTKMGKQEIKVIYNGSAKYEMSTATDYIYVNNKKVKVSVKSNNNDDFITKLEKLASLYERGLLTDEEFTEMKRKLI